MPQSPRPEPPVLKRGGFTVREDFFGVDGHPRVSDGHLRLLFSSQHPGPTCGIPEYAIPVYAAEAQRLFSRPFFAAQLRYYGIEHMAASNRDELGDLLEEAARTGECRIVPDYVVQLEKSLRRDYLPLLLAWKRDVSAWEARQRSPGGDASLAHRANSEAIQAIIQKAKAGPGPSADYYSRIFMAAPKKRMPRPEQPVLKRDGFIVRADRFGVDGHATDRISGGKLRQLFTAIKPDSTQPLMGIHAEKIFTGPFFAAQLRYYGIDYPAKFHYKASRKAELWKLLEQAAFAGMCNSVPSWVVQLEQSMMSEYKLLYRAWEQEAAEWDEREQPFKDAAWARCTTLLEQAECDVDMFFDHYFFTDGEPDPSKTPQPLGLRKPKQEGKLHDRALSIPGMCAEIGGRGGPNRTLCIGWNYARVFHLAEEANNASWFSAYPAERKKHDEFEARAMEAAELFTSFSKMKRAADADPEPPTPAVPQGIRGSYVVRCSQVESNWPGRELTIDIDSGPGEDVMQAAVDFGVIEGTMLLALTDDALDEHDVDTGFYRERAAPSQGRRPGPAKRARTDRPSLRFPFRLRGREDGERVIFYRSQRGFIEFTDETYTRFKGVFNCEDVARNAPMQGRRVDDDPRRVAETFGDFSEAQYEHERRAIWRGRH